VRAIAACAASVTRAAAARALALRNVLASFF